MQAFGFAAEFAAGDAAAGVHCNSNSSSAARHLQQLEAPAASAGAAFFQQVCGFFFFDLYSFISFILYFLYSSISFILLLF